MDDVPRFTGDERTRLRKRMQLFANNWRTREDLRQPAQTALRPAEAAKLDHLVQAFDHSDLRLGEFEDWELIALGLCLDEQRDLALLTKIMKEAAGRGLTYDAFTPAMLTTHFPL